MAAYQTIRVERRGPVAWVWLARPAVKNAMSVQMVDELLHALTTLEEARVSAHDTSQEPGAPRVLVLRGEGGTFCAGGDIKDMAGAAGDVRAIAAINRRFGELIMRVDRSPLATVAVLEGAVMGGGFGLCCVSDVAVAEGSTVFRLPETGLGVPPAQIAPFLVSRLGRSQARRLAVTGGKVLTQEALGLGLVHFVEEGTDAVEARVRAVLTDIGRCAPEAVATTKQLVQRAGHDPLEALLDDAAAAFAQAAAAGEGLAGMQAFLGKRPAPWSEAMGAALHPTPPQEPLA